MKTFQCDSCKAPIYFESVSCLHCGHSLSFLPDAMVMSALEPQQEGRWISLYGPTSHKLYRACSNSTDHATCNWMIDDSTQDNFCVACQRNDIIPDVSIPGHRDLWHKLELAKRRLLYTLQTLGLPMDNSAPRFRFLADLPGSPPVLTAYQNGLITVSLAEADDAVREQRRVQLHEPQRTLLNHLRHESGHHYWQILVANGSPQAMQLFRDHFGNEKSDYSQSLAHYYQSGPSPDWTATHVSAYASSHPWEDWAETWTHYLHWIDTLETAGAYALSVHDENTDTPSRPNLVRIQPGHRKPFDALLSDWRPLSVALNSLNRGAGLPDLYPFAIGPKAIEKLRVIHTLLENHGAHQLTSAHPMPTPQHHNKRFASTAQAQSI